MFLGEPAARARLNPHAFALRLVPRAFGVE